MITMTVPEWRAEAMRRFGPSPRAWAFRCTSCGQTQTLAECEAANMEPSVSYQECIGRHDKTRGCDWALFGFLQIHTVEVVDIPWLPVPVFEFAEVA